MIREHSFRIPASKCRNENKIIDLGKMIQQIKTLDEEKLKGNFTMEVQATDKPPDVTQHEKPSTSYEELLPKWLNLNLLKSLRQTSLTGKMGNMVTNETTGNKQI